MKRISLVIIIALSLVLMGCSTSLSLGKVEDNVYKNEYFGIEYRGLSGMSLFPNETMCELFDVDYGDNLSKEETLHLCLMAKSLDEAEILPRMSIQANKLDDDVEVLDYAVDYNIDLNNLFDETELSYVLMDQKIVLSLKAGTRNSSGRDLHTNFYFWKNNGYMMILTIVSNDAIDESQWIENIVFTQD